MNYITGLYDLEIKSCYPISAKDYEHVLYHPDFHDSNFAPSFDYVDFCRQDYAPKEANKYDFSWIIYYFLLFDINTYAYETSLKVKCECEDECERCLCYKELH